MGANERPQPARRLKITGGGDHFAGSVSGRKRAASPGLAVLTPVMQSGREPEPAADKAANALHNPVTLPVVCHLMLLRS